MSSIKLKKKKKRFFSQAKTLENLYKLKCFLPTGLIRWVSWEEVKQHSGKTADFGCLKLLHNRTIRIARFHLPHIRGDDKELCINLPVIDGEVVITWVIVAIKRQ